jgi:steroid Delta-isomerase
MLERETITKAIHEYCRAENQKDKAAWLALFSHDIRHEDPVGAPANEGLSKLSAFWDSFQPYNVEVWLTAPIIVCGNEAIAQVRGRLGPPESRKETGTVIDHFTFHNAGKITSVRAFFEPF